MPGVLLECHAEPAQALFRLAVAQENDSRFGTQRRIVGRPEHFLEYFIDAFQVGIDALESYPALAGLVGPALLLQTLIKAIVGLTVVGCQSHRLA